MAYKGVAQDFFTTLANQTANRAFGTAYQNLSPGPLVVSVTATANASNATTWTVQMGATAAGVANIAQSYSAANTTGDFQFVVPSGFWYQINSNNTSTITYWTELA